jgi:hypothetical protein
MGLGLKRPFINIVESEGRHIELLTEYILPIYLPDP